jgi:hypothetical protein
MSDLLRRLATSALGPHGTVRPRVPGLFEPSAPQPVELPGPSGARPSAESDADAEIRRSRATGEADASPGTLEPLARDGARRYATGRQEPRLARTERRATAVRTPATPSSVLQGKSGASSRLAVDRSQPDTGTANGPPGPLHATVRRPRADGNPMVAWSEPPAAPIGVQPSSPTRRRDDARTGQPVVRIPTASIRPAAPPPASARSAPRPAPAALDARAANDAPAIRITIGRIEVRAVTPASAAAARPAQTAPKDSLQDYLKRPKAGRR